MNKLFTKIAALTLGATMAVGVGVAVASSSKASPVSAASAQWQLVTSAPSDWSGEYILGNGTSGTIKIMDGSSFSSSSCAGVDATVSSSKITADEADALTIAKSSTSGKYTVKVNGKFIGKNANSNGIDANATWSSNLDNDITYSSNKVVIKGNGGRVLTWYASNSNFRYYASSNNNSQLYKKVESKTLSSISVSGYTTSFTVGDTFSFGGTVTATYSDSSSANVTSSTTFSGYNMNTAGNYTVTASYTEGSVTKTATYAITVAAATSPTLSFDKASFSGYTGQSVSVTATYANLESDLAWSASGTGSISGGSITWSSDDHRNGTSTYTATLSGEGGKTIVADATGVDAAQCVVTITQTTVDITKASTSIAQGKSETLAASHNASSVGGLTWTSSNDSVAAVDSSGKVTVAAGATVGATVTITATSSVDTSVSDTCTVTVTEAPLEYEIIFGTAEGTSGITDFTNSSYVIPSGVTLGNITGNLYSNTSDKAASIRFGKSGTTGSFDATISGNYYITSVKCNLKYYGSDSTATFAVTPDGGSAISKSLTVDWADYTYDVSAAKAKTVTLGTDVNGKRAYLSGFTITYAAQKVLSNIALSGTYPTTFTKGDTFSHSGMVVTANYSDSTSATVTGSATWSSPDMSTPGAKTITVSYSDEYGSASQTYSITVSYANPTGITLSLNSKKLALLEEFELADVEVTINPSATANQSEYEWVVYDSDGLVDNDTYVFSNGVFYAMEPADAVILRCQSTKAGYAASVYADVTVEITGDPIAHIKDEGDHDVTEGSTTIYADAGVISYSVATENFQGTLTYTWSSSNPSAISVKENADEMCDYQVNAAGSARLSCRVQGSVKGDVTVYTDVTVSAVTVTSVTWTAPTIDVFSGATLTTSDVSSWNVKYSTDSGKTNQTAPVGEITVKVNGAAVSLPHTWIAANDGKTLCVEYKGVSSSTTTVAVTQSIHSVMAPVSGDPSTSTLTFTAACGGSGTADDSKAWTVTSDGTESTFDSQNGKGIHYGTGSAAVQYIKLTSTDFTVGKITKVEVNASTASGVSATVSVTVGGEAFGGDPQALTSSAVPDNPYTFTGDADADTIEVLITKPSSATKAIYCKSIAVTYATDSGEDVEIANVAEHKAAQRAAVAFAQAFNAAMDDTENCTTGLDDAWSTCSSAYTSFKSAAAALGSTEEAYAKNLVKYATAQYSDDSGEACIERMMKTYEVCVQKHGKTAFMDDLVTLGRAPSINPVLANLSGANNTTITIAIVISLVSVTAIGGYFFLRKRKENI